MPMRHRQAVVIETPKRRQAVRLHFRASRQRQAVDLKVDYASDSYAVVAEAYETGTRVSLNGKTAREIIEDLF